MSKEKYYTPSIEEFYVGFEFYISYVDTEQYVKHIYTLNTPEYCFDITYNQKETTYSIPECLKVKFLDKEDIESFGFKQITDDCFNLNLKDEELRLLFESQKIVIFFADKYSNPLFQGTIKNKSELKKLLTQLGIN